MKRDVSSVSTGFNLCVENERADGGRDHRTCFEISICQTRLADRMQDWQSYPAESEATLSYYLTLYIRKYIGYCNVELVTKKSSLRKVCYIE